MISTDLPDVNVLFAFVNADHEHHLRAVSWMDSTDRFAVTPLTQSALMRLLMNPRATPNSLTAQTAIQVVKDLRGLPGAVFWPNSIDLGQDFPFAYALQGHQQVTDLLLVGLAAGQRGRLVTLDAKIEAALKPADRQHIHTLLPIVH